MLAATVLEPFQLPFVQRALVELLLLAVLAGTLGCWIVLRGLAFPAHGAAAAAFPGLVLADGLGFAAPLGGFGAALLFALAVGAPRAPRGAAADDALTALVLVAALAAGIVLASDVFHSAASVESLLFGSLLAIGPPTCGSPPRPRSSRSPPTRLLGARWLAPASTRPRRARSACARAARTSLLLVLVAFGAVATLSAVGALLATALLVVPAATRACVSDRIPAGSSPRSRSPPPRARSASGSRSSSTRRPARRSPSSPARAFALAAVARRACADG